MRELEYDDFEQIYAFGARLARRSNGLVYFDDNIITPDVDTHPLGWTQIIPGYGIYNSKLYRIMYSSYSVITTVPVTINGVSTSGWTKITGSQGYGGQAYMVRWH